MMTTTQERSTAPSLARVALQKAGNPFRNYFARNPDDDICARFHVPELYATERDLLLAVVDLYRADGATHSEVVPILGNKGAGKTHLLHSIKHGVGGAWQLVVTPGVYQKDTDFPEYLLYQIIDTLLGGGKQKGVRPLEYVGDMLVRRCLSAALRGLTPEQRIELFPPPGFGKWARRLGLGSTQASERAEWLADALTAPAGRTPLPLAQALADSGLTAERAFALVAEVVAAREPHNTTGIMRRYVLHGFAKAALLKDEAELASFLTFGFTELDFQVRPSRQELVLALFKVLSGIFRDMRIPVVVAFDQLEDLLLARRTDDGHKVAEAFFAGIVQTMHQIDGLCFLVFAERGLWNRFVPSLDGYIQDRLNNPVHVPNHGTVKAVRLEAPPLAQVRQVVEARLRPVQDALPAGTAYASLYPFGDEQLERIVRTEPTLRDMLQQFRHLFDHLVYDGAATSLLSDDMPITVQPDSPTYDRDAVFAAADQQTRIDSLLGKESAIIEAPPMNFKHVTILEAREDTAPTVTYEISTAPAALPVFETYERPSSALSFETLTDLYEQEVRSARRRLEPDGAVTGSTRELQAALGTFLSTCHEHGVKVGPWRLQHVVPEWPFGDHPTYGVVSLAHWACQDGPPWKVGVGLFLARGPGKPKDLEIKLSILGVEPGLVDHLILLRPEDDLNLTGKSKTLWQDAERRGHHARLEAASLESLARLAAIPRWLAAVRESLPEGTPVPNLADVIQVKCESLLQQVCMPTQS